MTLKVNTICLISDETSSFYGLEGVIAAPLKPYLHISGAMVDAYKVRLLAADVEILTLPAQLTILPHRDTPTTWDNCVFQPSNIQ